MSSKFDFPDCMHTMAAAFHMQGIDPHDIIINIPRDRWWDLHCAMERKLPGFMRFDGRHGEPGEFQYMGFRFRPTTL